ncbi:MAG: cytidylate kinase-like family protein [Ignavibacteria bacterium]|nr:cytidylate kinase-like family protein [Ignavibacteria bacterium]NCS82567.1 cytidylate kinase-like family protein [Ignavibacteria bacterium]
MSENSAFVKAKHYVDSHMHDIDAKNKGTVGPCITISREAGSGSGLIAEKIIHFLQPFAKNQESAWAIFDKNLIERVLEDHHLPKQIAKFLSEEKKPLLTQTLNEMLGIHPPLMKLYHKTAETILNLAHIGNCIIVGRGANIITSSLKNAYHVRLVAPLEFRINNVQEFYGNTKTEAVAFVKKEDAKRSAFIKDHFNKNAEDPLLYHSILNTANFSIDEIAEIIAWSVRIKFSKYYLE